MKSTDIYLDNAATSFPKPPEVYRAVMNTMTAIGANPGRGGHKPSLKASRLVYECREEIARFINAGSSDTVVFTANATEALNIAIKGVLHRGDEVITSPLEHNSVLRPLHALERKKLITVRYIPCDRQGRFNSGDVERLFTGKTRLVVLTHASNVTGGITPVEKVFRLCRKKRITTLLDAAQTAGILPIDVEAMNIDMLACPGHKGLLGPQGTGFLYVRKGIDLATIKEGGTGSRSSSIVQPSEMPDRLESGTLNTPGIAGLLAGVRFINKTGIEKIRSHELSLCKHLNNWFAAYRGVSVYGPKDPEKRVSTVSFNLQGMACSDVGFILSEVYDIYVRVGLHCAPLAHRLIGTYPQGTVRVSPGYFNTERQIDELVTALSEISEKK